ncbi:hypothetical protein P5P81_13630 [Tritonibacter mobilis]|nr:hypothetical protein [Tritonibacter mobilis]
MIEVKASENRGSSRLKRVSRWVKLNFNRHEIWAVKAAQKVPLFALFAFGTLWIWFFLPMIPIGILSVVLLENTGFLGAVFSLVLGLGGLAIVSPWFFRWYFICAGLMFGRTQMAKSKENEVSNRLKLLEDTKAPS